MAKAICFGIGLLWAQAAADPLKSIFRVRIPEPKHLTFSVPEEDNFVDLKLAKTEYLYYPYNEVNKQSGRHISSDPPWSLTANPECKVYRSHFVTMKLESYFSQLAPGLNASYREVFNALERHFCVPYVVGGLIRDILWRKEGLDTDIGFTCPLVEIKQICDNHGWPVLLRENYHYMRIGTPGVSDPIEGKIVEDSLYAPVRNLEYTVNSLAYDAGINSAIIDRTGYGVEDDQKKIIRIPGDWKTEWAGWIEGRGGTVKIFRFWKLRAKPKAFTAEPKTLDFIVKTLKQRMLEQKADTQSEGMWQFKHFLEGLEKENAEEKLGFLREAMIEDLGEEWYNANIKPLEPQFSDKSNDIVV